MGCKAFVCTDVPRAIPGCPPGMYRTPESAYKSSYIAVCCMNTSGLSYSNMFCLDLSKLHSKYCYEQKSLMKKRFRKQLMLLRVVPDQIRLH